MKTKIKSHGEEVIEFYVKEISKVDSNHTCLEVISLDAGNNYYPHVFLKAYQYIEENVVRHIHDNLSGFSSDDDVFDESDEE